MAILFEATSGAFFSLKMEKKEANIMGFGKFPEIDWQKPGSGLRDGYASPRGKPP